MTEAEGESDEMAAEDTKDGYVETVFGDVGVGVSCIPIGRWRNGVDGAGRPEMALPLLLLPETTRSVVPLATGYRCV